MFENFRRYRRYSISTKAVVKRLNTGSPEGFDAQVTTISQGGLGFYSDVPIEKATPVSVKFLLQTFKIEGKDTLEGRIASICRQGKDYYVGVAFDREIAYDRFVEVIG